VQTPADSLDPSELKARLKRAIAAGAYENQAKFAAAAGVTANHVSQLLTDKGVKPDALVKIDAALKQQGY
jgi:hypothetical protein